jgi:hypothetical protein
MPFTWIEQARADAKAAAAARPSGYYWIRRVEPDGPPFWEVARFDAPAGARPAGWYLTGHDRMFFEVAKPFSNAWTIGPRVEEPATMEPCNPPSAAS